MDTWLELIAEEKINRAEFLCRVQVITTVALVLVCGLYTFFQTFKEFEADVRAFFENFKDYEAKLRQFIGIELHLLKAV